MESPASTTSPPRNQMSLVRSQFERKIISVFFFLCIASASPVLDAQESDANLKEAKALKETFSSRVKPLLATYCADCHNADDMESGIRVDHLDGSMKEERLNLWNAIQKNVSENHMPPEEADQPKDDDRKALVDWITVAMKHARSRPQPKNGTERRLTVAQYKNTLKELLGLHEEVAAAIPPDSLSKDGFLNNEKSMLLSPLLIEAYFESAQKALDLSIVDEKSRPVIQNFRVDLGRGTNQDPYPQKLILGANSLLLDNRDFSVHELQAQKPFPFETFRMQRKFRFIEGYRGNATVRGWRDFDSIYHAVFACMRGNPGYPKGLAYQTVPQGLLLRPAIPSRELFGVESTYGPRANFKIALRELPQYGNFKIKIKAAKYNDGLLLDRGQKADVVPDQKTLVIEEPSEENTIDIPREGIYQVIVQTGPKYAKKPKPNSSRLKEKLIGAWSFETPYDEDRSTANLKGKPQGNIQIADSPFGHALELDGQDDSLMVKRTKSMDVGKGEFSVSAWIRPTQLRQAGIVCLGKYSWTHGWYFDMPGGNGVLRIETVNPDNQPNGTVKSRPGVIRNNQWQHVAAVVRRHPQETVLYVNGFEVARGAIQNRNLDNPRVDLYIGRIQNSQLFKGNIDSVRIYQRALDESEIQALMAGGERFIKPPPTDKKPQNIDLVLEDKKYGIREFSSKLTQPEYLLVRIAKNQLKLKAKYAGQRISQIELQPVNEKSELGRQFLKFEARKPKLGVYVGLRRDCGDTLAPVSSPQVVDSNEFHEYEFFGAINNFPSPDVEKNNVNYLAGVREIGIRSEYTDGREMPRLLIRSVEFEGPYFENWPPTSHKNIFFDSEEKRNQSEYARQVIERFATRAYRRPASRQEVDSLVKVYEESFKQTNDFQSSVKDALLVVLTSPQFLFLIENSSSPAAEPLDPFELASKLSYFLRNAPPDRETLELASDNKLRSSLEQEIARMIASEEFDDFCDSFCRQWLNLEKLDVVEVDRKKFPRLTREVKKELGREPIAFLKYLVQTNKPVRELIKADYILANEITGSYYQLASLPESGFEFRPVAVKRSELGGLLGHAGILSGLSDGREANPIKRGAWLARKIVAEPPDDPPPNVPELGEDTSHLPLRERLALHRNQKGCANCHSRIDPWGLPLEQFDAGGVFNSKPNPNSHSVLPDSTEIKGFLDLKNYLASERIDQVVFSFVKHLTTYAIGRSLTYNELESLKQDCLKLKVKDYRMQEIFLLVVQSKMFLEK